MRISACVLRFRFFWGARRIGGKSEAGVVGESLRESLREKVSYTDTTKKVCTYSAISIFLIVLFVISPLRNYLVASIIMKVVILLLLGFTIYLNIQQTNYLRMATQANISGEVSNQLTINIVSSYVFTLFIGLLIIFVIKSFL